MTDSKILGDYNIIKQIGQGPLGTVFLAEHRFMKKQYALKVLPQELSTDRSFIQRFEEEVSKLSKLDHPHIVKVHNISYANGLYFLVMDCIVDEMGETTNLAQYILSQGQRIAEKELFRLLEQVADALDEAHSKKFSDKGISHCGLKLNNILVSKGRGGVNLHISDFGLTRIVGPGAILTRTFKTVAEALEADAIVTPPLGSEDKYPNPPLHQDKLNPLHASFLQTYSFLAPEQKSLYHKGREDIKVDVYAFGILAYFLMTGQFPEGYFDLPSLCVPEYRWNWDGLIKGCLQADPEKRIEQLLPTLRSVSSTQAASIPAPVKNESTPLPAPPIQTPAAQPAGQKVEGTTPQPIVEKFVLDPTPVTAPAPQPMAAVAASAAPAEAQHTVLKPIIHGAHLERPVTDPEPSSVFTVESSVTHYIPERKEVKEIQPILTDMIVIRGGTFWRGSQDGNRDEIPCHQVTIDSFAIDTHPVTNEQFVRFLEVLGGEKDNNHHDVIRLKDSRIKRSGGKLSIESGYSKHPVVGVTWYGAVAYAKWVGKRLPTEAEWEVASKGGNENALYPTGSDIEKSQANFFSSDTTPVMSYAPNGYGLFDIAGNVYEWCHDWYGYNYYEVSIQEPDNPKGPLQGNYRVLRGGCWKSLKDDLRCSRRHRNNPGTVNGTYGFRCSADVQ